MGENEVCQMGPCEKPLETGKKKKMKSSVERKLARNSGEEYFTQKGKYIMPKSFKFHKCSCQYECKNVVIEERKVIFKNFWASKCWQSQQNFISSCISVTNAKRHYVENSRKQNSRKFILNNKRVCKAVFLHTLGISNGRMSYCITKKAPNNICSPDKRGTVTPNKTSGLKIKEIYDFLNSIPKYTSHYSNNDKLYFSENLTRTKLFEEYKKKQSEKSKEAVSKPVFYRVFKQYNIGIYVPKTDTCQLCDSGAIKMKFSAEEEKDKIKKDLEIHLGLAEKAREHLKQATAESKVSPSLLTFTFDMQKNQPLPRLQTSVVFYKRQLWMLNVGINDRSTNQGYMCMWDETEGKRGAKEICSSILAFLDTIETSTVTRVKSFSDACGGQNRNKAIICFFMWLCDIKGFESWEHCFMESGHSYLPNDRDFSVIEKKAKGRIVQSKEGWIELVKNSMVKRPFVVIEMNKKFVDIDVLANQRKFVNTHTTDDSKFNFLHLKSFTVRQNSPIVSYKTTSGGSHQFTYPLIGSQPETLQSSCNPNPISREKYADIQSLLPYVPPIYHDFYKNLAHK